MNAPIDRDEPTKATSRHASIGFGIERLGVAAVRMPRVALATLALSLAIAAIGIPQLHFDDNLQNAFDSGAPEDAAYRKLATDFAVGEAEVLLLAEAPSFAAPAAIEVLRRVHFEAQLLDGVIGVTSVFSLREAPQGASPPAPILGPEISPEAIGSALARIDRHPFNLGKLLSSDRSSALLSVRASPDIDNLGKQSRLIDELRATVAAAVQDSEVTVTVTGIPALRIEIVRRLIADSITVNMLGASIAIVVGFLLFRSVRLTVITAAPALFAAATVLGGMGLTGVAINAMTLVIPVLILVMVFADSMHLTFAWLRCRSARASPEDAAQTALVQVGPACVLASATTIIAFGTFAISGTYIVQEFGIAGAVANALGLCVLLVSHPILCLFVGAGAPGADPALGLHGAFAKIAAPASRLVAARYRAIVKIGIVLTVISAVAHLSLPPNYLIREHLPSDDAANAALERIDRRLRGAYAVQIPVPLPANADGIDRAALEAIRTVHTAVNEALPDAVVFSAWNLAEWLGAEDAGAAAPRVGALWKNLTPEQRRRLITADGTAALVTTWIREMPAAETDRLVAHIEAAIAERRSPLHATGLVVHSARKAQQILGELKLSLLVAVVLAIGLIALAFRSISAGLFSLVPNVLPIFVTGTFLLLLGKGLQFASALALTIAFGIAVNDTIHFLSRYRHERAAGRECVAAALDTIRAVGPIMISTTLVLCCGLAATLVSNLPLTVLFGILCVLLLLTALLADLILLPSLILEYPKRWKKDL